MAINIPIKPDVRHPRAIVQLNGINIRWLNIEITEKNFYLSDDCRVEVPLYDDDNEIIFDIDYWASQSDILVEIFIGFPFDPNAYSISSLDSMFMGKADNLGIDLVRGLVTITGRDLSSILIDKKTTELFPSKTASQIVTKFAVDNGLTPVVTATTKDVGVYQQQFSKITRQRSLWDICTFLADHEDFNVFVRGQELHFEPKPALIRSMFFLILSR